MKPLRTPLEQELGDQLPLDMGDLTYEDLDAAEAEHEAREAALLARAVATGDFLYRSAIRSAVPGFEGRRPSVPTRIYPVTTRKAS